MAGSPLTERQLRHHLNALSSALSVNAGGAKWVYDAQIGGRREALKVIPMPVFSPADGEEELAEAYTQECLARVVREVETIGKCTVPELVRLGSLAPCSFIEGERQYLAYSEEFVEGRDLAQEIRAVTGLPLLRELAALGVSLLRAIQELWSLGTVHRDIKPGNVIATDRPDRPFVLLDLGIAFSVTDTRLTVNPDQRFPVATYMYIAPELLPPGSREFDFRADLYTTGLTVFEYATKRHPYCQLADSLETCCRRAKEDRPPPLSHLRKDLPDAFCGLVDSWLRKKPALRPSRLCQLIARLEGWL